MAEQWFWRSPALPFAEFRCARSSTARYVPHTHPYLSVGCVDAGESEFCHDGVCQRLHAGDVVIIPAALAHACNPAKDSLWAYRMLNLAPDWLHELIRELGEPAPQAMIHPAASPHALRIRSALDRLAEALRAPCDPADKEAALISFAAEAFAPAASLAQHQPELAPPRLRAIQHLITERCAENLSLKELAALADLSRYHFIRAFRHSVGMTPHAWQMDARINRARKMLDQDYPLADIALQLGFADQSHFQRVFKQRVAVTPHQYRRNFVQDFR